MINIRNWSIGKFGKFLIFLGLSMFLLTHFLNQTYEMQQTRTGRKNKNVADTIIGKPYSLTKRKV